MGAQVWEKHRRKHTRTALGDVIQKNDTDGSILLQVEDNSVGDGGGVHLNLQHGVVGNGHLAAAGGNSGNGTVNSLEETDLLLGVQMLLVHGRAGLGGSLLGGCG